MIREARTTRIPRHVLDDNPDGRVVSDTIDELIDDLTFEGCAYSSLEWSAERDPATGDVIVDVTGARAPDDVPAPTGISWPWAVIAAVGGLSFSGAVVAVVVAIAEAVQP